mgnify:CR=1 FL=1
MVEKTARSADNDSRIAFQLAQLVFDRASADDVSSVDIELDGKGAQHIKNLSGEFSRRRHDETCVVFFSVSTLWITGSR